MVREIIEFIKGHQLLFDQILQEDLSDANELTMEIINLVVGILSKVKIQMYLLNLILECQQDACDCCVYISCPDSIGCISCIIDAN